MYEKDLEEKITAITTSTPYRPQLSWLAEPMNRARFDRVRALLKNVRMPWSYWGEALTHAVTVHNCTISRAIMNTAP